MNEYQRKFFDYLANLQEECVQICMSQNKCTDKKIESMLYDVTYNMTTEIMTLIDGYSSFCSDKLDIVNTVTGECLKENPFIELHDATDGILKY